MKCEILYGQCPVLIMVENVTEHDGSTGDGDCSCGKYGVDDSCSNDIP